MAKLRFGSVWAGLVALTTTVLTVGVLAKGTPKGVNGSTNTGIHASIDLRTLSQAKDEIFDQIISFIDDVKIPDVQLKGNKGYLIENSFHLSQNNKIVNFYNDVSNNAVVFEADNLSATFHCGHFKLKEGFVQAKGHADVDLQRLKLQVGIGFTTQTLPDGRTLPAIKTVDVQFMISEQDIQVHLHGNVWSEFAGSFISFFKGPMIKLIETSNQKAINLALPTAVNSAIAASNGSLNFIDPNWQLNVITPAAPKVSLDSISVGVKGLFFDQRIGDYDRVRFPTMPFKNATHLDTMQMFLSMQSLDSFFESYLDVHEGQGWYNETQLPHPLDFTLTTQDLNIMLPGMVPTYGKNKQVKLEYKVEDFGDFRSRFAKPYMIATATVNLRFWVVKAPGQEELAVELNLYNITNKVFVNEKPDLKMSLMIGEFRLHGVEVVDSRIGMLNPNTIRLKLNTVNSVIVTLTNIILQRFEVQVPNTMLGGLFSLKQLHLEYFDGYIYAGVTPVYVPQAPRLPHTVHDHTSAQHDPVHHPLPMNEIMDDHRYWMDDEHDSDYKYADEFDNDRKYHHQDDDFEDSDDSDFYGRSSDYGYGHEEAQFGREHDHFHNTYGSEYHHGYGGRDHHQDERVRYNGHDFQFIAN